LIIGSLFFQSFSGAGREPRSIHFILLIGYLCFLAVRVGVAVTGVVRNMNHIVTGRDDAHLILNIRATALIGVPSQSAAKTKACFSLKNQIRVNKKRYILFQMAKKQRGGKRKGAGRKPESNAIHGHAHKSERGTSKEAGI
jgi:hypothetical protein